MGDIVAFSKYLAYGTGGAEKSTLAILRRLHEEGSRVTVVSLADARFLGRRMEQVALPAEWERCYIEGMTQLPRFSYYEYMINRKRIMKFFSEHLAEELITYGVWAPAAIMGFGGKSRYYIRSETDLGIIGNYHKGGLRYLKSLYSALEWPAIVQYRRDLEVVMGSARIIANSNYMARRTREIFGIDAEVVYPVIELDKLKERVRTSVDSSGDYVLFMGDSLYKGSDLVGEMAKKLPGVRFRICSRFVSREYKKNNILWSPWQQDVSSIYASAALVIVPSQCEEAFGRVAREAYMLGIPVLVSNAGGLPEAVEYNQKCLVDDYRNVDVWIDRVSSYMGAVRKK